MEDLSHYTLMLNNLQFPPVVEQTGGEYYIYMTTDYVIFVIALLSLLFSMSIGIFIYGGYEATVAISYYYY